MSCICCVNTLDLGCVTVCDNLTISYISPNAQTYKLLVDFGQQLVEIFAPTDAGNDLVFDISTLNEMYMFKGQIFDEAGNQLSFQDASLNTYDCFSFTTILGPTSNQPSINLTLAP